MSHVVISCECREDRDREVAKCQVPGHGVVPPDPVDPWTLVAAGEEAVPHLRAAITALMSARAAWVSRGLDADNPFPRSLDTLAASMARQTDQMVRWTAAARVVAYKREREA